MSETTDFDPVPLTPVRAEPTPTPMPTTEPAASKPAPKPSRTAWVAEVLRLAARPTKRKGVAAAGILSLVAGAGAARLMWPIKQQSPAVESREVAEADALPRSPLQPKEGERKEEEANKEEKKSAEQQPPVPAVPEVILPPLFGAGGSQPKVEDKSVLPPPVVATEKPSDLPPPKVDFGQPDAAIENRQAEPTAKYGRYFPGEIYGPPAPAFVDERRADEYRHYFFGEVYGPPAPPRPLPAFVVREPSPPSPIQQVAATGPSPGDDVKAPKIDGIPITIDPPKLPDPAPGGGFALPNIELPKEPAPATPETPKVELPAAKSEQPPVSKPAETAMKDANPPKPIQQEKPAFESPKPAVVADPPKIELPPPQPVVPPPLPPRQPANAGRSPAAELPKVEMPVNPPKVDPPAPLPVARPDPAVARAAAQTTFDVDLHEVRTGDTFAAISRKHLGDDRYAEAVRAFNGGRGLHEIATVEVPPIHVLRQSFSHLIGGAAPKVPPAATGPAARPAGTKTFVTPAGGITMKGIARQAFGEETKWPEVWDLNPQLDTKGVLPEGTTVKLPAGRADRKVRG